MSTGKRLAKRSIIGTRVCARSRPDGLWYSGVIQDVKTPSINPMLENNNCINLTPDTRYSVRFDFKTQICGETVNANSMNMTAITNFISPAQSVRRNAMIKEFLETELIGPGFRTILGVQLQPGQRVFLTHNGREVSGDVLTHDLEKDEVSVKISPTGYEEPLELKKRLEEVRLLESRRSARLADQDRDTDFARLADMAGDRRRASHSIDVPLALTQQNSRKRRPSYSQDERDNYLPAFRDDDQMDACNAALVLMSLSCSPHSPRAGQWNTVLGSSPGSSSASWSSSGSSSPPLSDDGQPPIGDSTARLRTTSLSTSDEGIVMDYSDEAPRKRRAHGTTIYQCTWKGCGIIEVTVAKIELHVRNSHLGPKKPRQSYEDDAFSDSDHEEEFYYTEIEDEGKAPSPPSPPTLSHRDMARPPHEDPEYQRQIVGNFRQGLLALSSSSLNKTASPTAITISNMNSAAIGNISTANHHHAGPINIPTSPLAHHNYTWSAPSPVSPHKHARWSPRPSTSSAPYPSPTYIHQHHHNYNNSSNNNNHNSNHNTNNTNNNSSSSNLQHQTQQNFGIAHATAATTALSTNLSHSAPTNGSGIVAASHHQTSAQHHPHPHPNHNQSLHHSNSSNSSQNSHQSSGSHYHHTNIIAGGGSVHHLISPVQASSKHSPQSPNRRTRGENKKCRKVYGMDHKDQWCTQCKWKKACSRFGD